MAIRFQYVQIRQVSFRLETIDENENEVAFEKIWKRGTSDSNTAIYINPNIKQESSDIVEIEKYRISGYQFHRYHLGEDRYLTHLLMIKPTIIMLYQDTQIYRSLFLCFVFLPTSQGFLKAHCLQLVPLNYSLTMAMA